MKKICIIIICLLSIISAKGQNNIIFTGKVVDNREKSTPIPFCNVYVEYTSIGTITNSEGKFRIAVPKNNTDKICISFIGYKTKKLDIYSLKSENNVIYLTRDAINLGEVIIVPDSTLLGFLKKAYKAIDKNYPQQPTKIKGFYRETKLTDKEEYLYFSEAILNIYKKSYKNSDDPGQIEVIESRKKNFPISEDVNNVKFYAGAFIPLSNDIVKNRIEFINPKFFDKYSYSLTNTFKQDDRILYEISFDTKNDSLKGIYKGKFYLDKESLAYIMCEYENTNRGIEKYNSTNFTPYRGIERNFFVQYYFYNDKWHLKYCKMFGKGKNTKYNSNLKYADEFLTTSIMPDPVKPIPYEKRLGYYDIFVDKAIPYEESTWKDFNIIKTNDDLLFSIDQAKNVYEEEVDLTNENKIMSIFKRLSFNYGLIVVSNKISSGEYQLLLGNSTINQKINNKEYLLGLDATINYNLNKNFSIKYSTISTFDKNITMEYNGIGIGYLKNIKPKGRPLFLKLDIFGYKDYYGIIFDKSLANIEYNSEIISKSKLETSIGRICYGIKPQLILSFQATKFIEMYMSLSYNITLDKDYKIMFKEDSGLFKKSYKENIIESTLLYNGASFEENRLDMNPLIIGVGFNFGFN